MTSSAVSSHYVEPDIMESGATSISSSAAAKSMLGKSGKGDDESDSEDDSVGDLVDSRVG